MWDIKMFFVSAESILRIFVSGVFSYVWLIVILRTSGKRSLSKLNAFDFVITVALGSTLSSALLSKLASISDSTSALLLLVLLQFAVSWLAVRFRQFSHLVKSRPAAVFFQGKFLKEILISERMMEEEVLAAVRSRGTSDMAKVYAVVLETDGSISVILKDKSAESSFSALADVEGIRSESSGGGAP